MRKEVAKLQGKLIVSCQALETEPLYSSFIMGRMARAAKEGGASGIRANTVEDIIEIRKNVDLPIIGIIKRDYQDSQVYITPTMKEIDELMEVKCEIIALDATKRIRPGNLTLEEFYKNIRKKYPDQILLADCSTIEEVLYADELGFDFVGTTLFGYTEYSKELMNQNCDEMNQKYEESIRVILDKVKGKVIAEGNIDTPEIAQKVIKRGCFSVVVGSAITRPQLITRKFVQAINSK